MEQVLKACIDGDPPDLPFQSSSALASSAEDFSDEDTTGIQVWCFPFVQSKGGVQVLQHFLLATLELLRKRSLRCCRQSINSSLKVNNVGASKEMANNVARKLVLAWIQTFSEERLNVVL